MYGTVGRRMKPPTPTLASPPALTSPPALASPSNPLLFFTSPHQPPQPGRAASLHDTLIGGLIGFRLRPRLALVSSAG